MKVKFHEIEYAVVGSHINTMPVGNFEVTIEKGSNTIDSIIADATNASVITALDDDGRVIGVYNGYTKLNSVITYDGVTVSVSLLNEDIQSQLNAIMNSVNDIRNDVANQNAIIDRVTLTTQELADSQITQDHAIEDLGEAVSDLTPEEG